MSKQYRSCKSLRYFKVRCGELEELHLFYHLVDTTSALFANSESPHQRGQCFITGFGRCINEPLSINQGLTGIGDFYAVVEYFHHGPCAGNEHILMNQRISR